MNSCEIRKCKYWNGEFCTDTEELYNALNGGLCCRYHLNAVTMEQLKEIRPELFDTVKAERVKELEGEDGNKSSYL